MWSTPRYEGFVASTVVRLPHPFPYESDGMTSRPSCDHVHTICWQVPLSLGVSFAIGDDHPGPSSQQLRLRRVHDEGSIPTSSPRCHSSISAIGLPVSRAAILPPRCVEVWLPHPSLCMDPAPHLLTYDSPRRNSGLLPFRAMRASPLGWLLGTSILVSLSDGSPRPPYYHGPKAQV